MANIMIVDDSAAMRLIISRSLQKRYQAAPTASKNRSLPDSLTDSWGNCYEP